MSVLNGEIVGFGIGAPYYHEGLPSNWPAWQVSKGVHIQVIVRSLKKGWVKPNLGTRYAV